MSGYIYNLFVLSISSGHRPLITPLVWRCWATSGARPLPGSAFPSATSPRTLSGRRGWRGKGQPGVRSTRTRFGSWRERGLSWRWRGSGSPITLWSYKQQPESWSIINISIVFVTTEGVGAAFVVPQLSNLTRKYHLPHVSIFTAELVAILIALNFFNDLCQPPMAVSGVCVFLTRCRRCRPSNTTVSLLEKTPLKK